MDLDPEGIFRDDSDSDGELFEDEATKELLVYLIDASPKMFALINAQEDEKRETYFHAAIDCIAQSLKSQIIGRSYDEVALCFFNTKEKKNLQDLNSVYVFNVTEREPLDRPTAKLIKDFSSVEDSFMGNIGSWYGILPGSRDNSLYNALWVAQALLRKGSVRTYSKRILILTNEDDPFGGITGAIKADMIRTTIQRAKDAQDLGITIELLPLSRPDEEFKVSLFYADLIGLEGTEISEFLPSTSEKLEIMKDQLRKRIIKKRKVTTLTFSITNGISIQVNTYALIRPTQPGAIMWLDSATNLPLKVERSLICADTGSLIQKPPNVFHPYKNQIVQFSMNQISEIKKVSSNQLRLLGFKPLNCLKDYHNLRPSTFIFPTDEVKVCSFCRDMGKNWKYSDFCRFISINATSTTVASKYPQPFRRFIEIRGLADSIEMKRIQQLEIIHTLIVPRKVNATSKCSTWFALAFYGRSGNPRLVALVAQEELLNPSGQLEPPGMHMIYLPYSDDIRHVEELHTMVDDVAPCATGEQIMKASALVKRINLKDFSVLQFSNPALQRHYGILQALALDEDEMPEIKDDTLPDEEGLAGPTVVRAIAEFKTAVYGSNCDQEDACMAAGAAAVCGASRKRKQIVETSARESSKYDWADLAESGELKNLTVVELKYYLTSNHLSLTGKKEDLINRILTHMGK